jgi:3-oxosteroid 1-dehydrogenase
MTAAIAAALRGLSVLVIEQSPWFGGTTAYSGGAIRVPGNRPLWGYGVGDSFEQGARWKPSSSTCARRRPRWTSRD